MQTGIIALELVARINKLDFDGRAVAREIGLESQEIAIEELVRLAQKNEFKAKIKTFSLADFPNKYPLPAIFCLKDNTYGVLLQRQTQDQKAMIFLPQQKETRLCTYTEFSALSTGQWIILRHKALNAQIVFGFKWFFLEILTYKQIITEVLLGSFIAQLFGLVTPLFTQVILDKVIVHRSLTTLNVLAVAFVMVAIFDFILNLTRNYLFIHTASKIDAKLGAKLFRHLFALPYRYFESRKVGNIIARVRELDTIREFITNKAVSVLIDLFFSSVFIVIMFFYSVKLTLLTLGVLTIIALLYFFVTPVFRARLETKFQLGAQSNSYLVESVTGIQTVKALAIEGSMQKKWEGYLGNYLNSSFKLGVLGNTTRSFSEFLQKFLTISILFLGVKAVMQNELTIGQLIAFQMFANQFINPVLRLVTLWNEFQQALLGVDRLGDILNHPVESATQKAITLPQLKGAIRIENLAFKYILDTPYVINNINFKIEPEMCVGLVGRSGSGKSTITKLIQRLYIANEGAIYIDDVDVRHMNPNWLRYQIGTVLQDNYLFSGTIRENICLAKPDASMAEIIEVSKIAGAHEFITQFVEGYDTIVGERGSSLSGGQKQRIAIARALITNPKILIFDEATSALDAESESIILNNIQQIRAGRTMIIIAHKFSAVRNCDLIFMLEKGVIVEAGTHRELIAKNGHYAELYRYQESEG